MKKIPDWPVKRCLTCDWEFYATDDEGNCPECGSPDWEFKLRGLKLVFETV